jgi:hypothetical protein
MKSKHQVLVEQYHADIEAHHGHNMHLMHRDWHSNNRDPSLPERQDPNWGLDFDVGTDFLQMHHEMVKASANEQKFQMHHASVAEWYSSQNVDLPLSWNPMEVIPDELGYEPDPQVFPDEIRTAIAQSANQEGQSLEQFLERRTDNPDFELPAYFTIKGVSSDDEADPLTGARKLADFKNTNQLGCCLIFPHNEWHGRIGGAMSSTWTAIADPIFYWGVHWFIDRIYDEYKILQKQREIRTFDTRVLQDINALESRVKRPSKAFTGEQKSAIQRFERASEVLHRLDRR